MALFELEGVSFRYGRHAALQGIDLQIKAGERIALLGANGSGKSTLLRLLDGLYLPTAGAIRFDSRPLTRENLEDASFAIAFRRRVGLLFQDPDVQLFNATVFDEVAFGPLQLGWPKQQILVSVEEALDLLAIAPLRDRAPFHLSGGEKKRVALASVLVLKPDVLLLDEPTAALDPKTEKQLLSFLSGLPRNTTLITATHDLHTLEAIADACCVLHEGRLLERGTTVEILRDAELLRHAGLADGTVAG